MNGGHAVHEAVRAFVERRGAWTLAAGPLPSNVLDVLKLAARAADKLDQWSLELNIPPQRLAEIAGSFIENVLITPEASHYRVLGVAPDASEARITVHYNWLMQWLRVGGHTPEMRAELSSRIKTAYRELGDVVRRATYDAAMSEALAARLAHDVEPAQYDPRKAARPAGPGAPSAEPAEQAADPKPAAVPEPPVAHKQPARSRHVPPPAAPPALRPGDDAWHTETMLLDPAELDVRADDSADLPAITAPESQADQVIELLSRPPPSPPERPVRSRLPIALAGVAVLATLALWVTQDRWRPWLEARVPARDAAPPPAQVETPSGVSESPAAPATPAVGHEETTAPPPAVEVAELAVQVEAPSAPPMADADESPAAMPAAAAAEPAVSEPAAESVAGPPDEPAAEPVPQPAEVAVVMVPSDPIVPAEARSAARRVADAYAAGDVLAVLNIMGRTGEMSQPELASMAADVERWWLERGGVPLAITATRVLPPLEPGAGDRAAVELRAPDDAGLRVMLQRDGLFWRVQAVLTIAPTGSRNGGVR